MASLPRGVPSVRVWAFMRRQRSVSRASRFTLTSDLETRSCFSTNLWAKVGQTRHRLRQQLELAKENGGGAGNRTRIHRLILHGFSGDSEAAREAATALRYSRQRAYRSRRSGAATRVKARGPRPRDRRRGARRAPRALPLVATDSPGVGKVRSGQGHVQQHHSGIRFTRQKNDAAPARNGVRPDDERERTKQAVGMRGCAQQQQHSNDH